MALFVNKSAQIREVYVLFKKEETDMSIKITKCKCLSATAFASAFFNFLAPLFTMVCSMTDKLNDLGVDAKVSTSGYAMLGERYYRLIDGVRPTLSVAVVWHIVLSVLVLGALVLHIFKFKNIKWFDIAIVCAGIVLSLIYTIFGVYGASEARAAGYNLYSVTTYAYIPLIISCVFGIVYFAIFTYVDSSFAFCFGGNARTASLESKDVALKEQNNK